LREKNLCCRKERDNCRGNFEEKKNQNAFESTHAVDVIWEFVEDKSRQQLKGKCRLEKAMSFLQEKMIEL